MTRRSFILPSTDNQSSAQYRDDSEHAPSGVSGYPSHPSEMYSQSKDGTEQSSPGISDSFYPAAQPPTETGPYAPNVGAVRDAMTYFDRRREFHGERDPSHDQSEQYAQPGFEEPRRYEDQSDSSSAHYGGYDSADYSPGTSESDYGDRGNYDQNRQSSDGYSTDVGTPAETDYGPRIHRGNENYGAGPSGGDGEDRGGDDSAPLFHQGEEAPMPQQMSLLWCPEEAYEQEQDEAKHCWPDGCEDERWDPTNYKDD